MTEVLTCIYSRLEDATDLEEEPVSQDFLDDTRDALRTSLALMYLVVDIAVRDSLHGDDGLRQAITSMEPSLLAFVTDWLERSRWTTVATLAPGKKLMLLYWKTILLYFGGSQHLDAIKTAVSPTRRDKDDRPLISASPLDYHIFRQEILSKYPAFDPPPPLFPYDPEHNTILPTLEDTPNGSTTDSRRSSFAGPANLDGASGNIIHQPVHIATPAPSPPPSPAIGPGGKGIKKQNYQTNQMFPFLYPPLGETSNHLGGKGSAATQDVLAGRKWEGSDIPTSILEAATLFSTRMRASRAMKQLWRERVHFMRYERGDTAGETETETDSSVEEDMELRELSEDLRSRLHAVEQYYVSRHSPLN
jgi:hypothetical protein